MFPAEKTIRVVTASFVAGVSAMALVGLVATVAIGGGLNVHAAEASEAAPSQGVEPFDVNAVKAQLAVAERNMATTRATTQRAMDRLERLSGR